MKKCLDGTLLVLAIYEVLRELLTSKIVNKDGDLV